MSRSEYDCRKRVPKREVFFQQMAAIIPWKRWGAMILLFYPKGVHDRPSQGN